jgi:hypothetical protein
MFDLLLHVMHFCASCVSDNNAIPPAAGALGGAAGAAGGLGGLGSLGAGQSSNAPATGAHASSSAPTATTTAPSTANTIPPAGTLDATDTGGAPDKSANNVFADESGGIAEHPGAPPDANPSDPFASPQSTPDPLFSDGPQVDGSSSPGDDTTETDYINADGTPMGSSPAAPQASGVGPHASASTHGVPHKPSKP